MYYPHLLVLPAYQGRDIGGEILHRLKRRYEGFHQHVLIADAKATRFYEAHGFSRAGQTTSMWIYDGHDH